MAKTRLTCENCGFDEELSKKQLKERGGPDGLLTCSACGAPLARPAGAKAAAGAKPARYAGIDDVTGLDDVIEGDVIEGEAMEANANQGGGPDETAPQAGAAEGVADQSAAAPAGPANAPADAAPKGSTAAAKADPAGVPPRSAEGPNALNTQDAPGRNIPLAGIYGDPVQAATGGAERTEPPRPEAAEARGAAGSNASASSASPENSAGSDASANSANSAGSASPENSANSAGSAGETLRRSVRYGRENPLLAAEILNRIFSGIAGGAEGRFDKIAAAATRIGHYTLLGTAALAAVFGLLISLRSLSLAPLLTGLVLAALLLFAQYLALRGFELLRGYIERNPSRLPGPALTEVVSALAVLAGLLSLLTGLFLTVNFYSPVWLGSSALGVIGGYFTAAVLLAAPTRLNVSFDAALPAGEAVVELARTLLKAVVAVVPFMFGLGSAAMSLCMIWPTVSMLLFSLNSINTASFYLQEGGLLFCAFSPILAYLFVLICDFVIEVARGLLRLGR